MKRKPTAAEGWLRNAGFIVGEEHVDPALRRQMAAALRLELHNKSAHRSGGTAGRKNEKTIAIENLIKRNLKNYPNDERTAPNLRLRAERTGAGRKLLKDMAPSTWARHVKNVLNVELD